MPHSQEIQSHRVLHIIVACSGASHRNLLFPVTPLWPKKDATPELGFSFSPLCQVRLHDK